MKTIIMAGGIGKRVAGINDNIPKPMFRIQDKPILEHQLECLIKNNLKDICMIVGHLGNIIKEYFGDGSRFGCNINYFTETNPLGTAGAIFKIKDELTEDFILLNGDIIFDMDFNRIISFHKEQKALLTLAVHPNNHPFDSAVIFTDRNCRVIQWLNKEDERTYYKNLVNAGIHIISPLLFNNFTPTNEKIDLDREIIKPLINTGRIFAYHTPEYIKDMGTPDRYEQVSHDINHGIVKNKNLSVKQKVVFLDRDGTINIYKEFIKKVEDFELIPNAAEAIKKINKLGYLSVVITNQPVIARGDISVDELEAMHMKLETELGKSGAYIDDLFYCPHHPDKGFPGELPEYKMICECRKPKPGLLFQAANKYNIDLSASYMIGDDMRDVQAGLNAGCIPVLLSKEKEEKEIIVEGKIVKVFPDLYSVFESGLIT